MMTLSLAYSPCPNDTFIFYALVQQKLFIPDLSLTEELEDVETLNKMAIQGKNDITKLSYHAFGYVREQYSLLSSGSALGKGCGPILISSKQISMDDLAGQRIAIPGNLTTAFLLLRLYEPRVNQIFIFPFDKIIPALLSGAADAGLIIHETRFTYQQFGLHQIVDLGDWWEQWSGYPIPLGGIAIKRSLGKDIAMSIEKGIRQSILYAKEHRREALDYIKQYSQEIEEAVIFKHIDLYVNEYSLDLGSEGKEAIYFLLSQAEQKGIITRSSYDPFW